MVKLVCIKRLQDNLISANMALDSNMVVYVMNRGPSPKGDEDEESAEVPTAAVGMPEHVEEGLLTPTSSVEQAAASLTTPIDTMPLPSGRSLPNSFSIPESLSFEGHGRQDRPYYATPPHYTDSFSQPMLSTPVSAEIISPHEVSVFDYPTSTPFPTSTPDHQRTTHGQYDAWTPTFRQNIFSPVDYSAPPSSQGMPQPHMSYHMPMASPAQLHDMSHHAHSPLDAMGQRALPFRTGSLGHPHGLPLSHPA